MRRCLVCLFIGTISAVPVPLADPSHPSFKAGTYSNETIMDGKRPDPFKKNCTKNHTELHGEPAKKKLPACPIPRLEIPGDKKLVTDQKPQQLEPDYNNKLYCPDCKELINGMITYCRGGSKNGVNKGDLDNYCASNWLPVSNNPKFSMGHDTTFEKVIMPDDSNPGTYKEKDMMINSWMYTKHSECSWLVGIVKKMGCPEPCDYLLNEPWNKALPVHEQHNAAKEICYSENVGVVKKKIAPNEFSKCSTCVERPAGEPHIEECTTPPKTFDPEFCRLSVQKMKKFCYNEKPEMTPQDFTGFCDSTVGDIQYNTPELKKECEDIKLAMFIKVDPASPCTVLNKCEADICPVILPMCPGQRPPGW